MRTGVRIIIVRELGVSHQAPRWLFSGGTFIQPFFCEDGREVIHMEAVAHTRAHWHALSLRDVSIAVVVSGDSIVEDAGGYDFSAFAEAHDFVTILCFSAVSVVHISFTLPNKLLEPTAGVPSVSDSICCRKSLVFAAVVQRVVPPCSSVVKTVQIWPFSSFPQLTLNYLQHCI